MKLTLDLKPAAARAVKSLSRNRRITLDEAASALIMTGITARPAPSVRHGIPLARNDGVCMTAEEVSHHPERGMTYLLDANGLAALLIPQHEHHERAHRFLGRRPFAVTPLTQLASLQILSRPRRVQERILPPLHPPAEACASCVWSPKGADASLSRLD